MRNTENQSRPVTVYKASDLAVHFRKSSRIGAYFVTAARHGVLTDLCQQRPEAEWREAIARDGLQAVAALTLWDAVETGYMHETPQLADAAAEWDGAGSVLVVDVTVDHLTAYWAGQGWVQSTSPSTTPPAGAV